MSSYYYLLFISLSLTFLSPIISDLSADRAALLRLQTAVRGRTLLWNTTAATPCSWHGVACSPTTNRVTSLRLPGSGLRGPLPPDSIGNLTQLQVLSLRGNSLSGQIPADLASCTLLEEIHLQGNSFSGEIPASFFTLTNLERVNLAGNAFSGNLPAGFNSLVNLRTLYLENNNFSGAFPDWNRLNQLRNLNVSFNGLTGSVPSTLSSFSDQSFLGTSLCLASCSSESGSSLSGGAIAGIVVGSVVLLLLIAVILFVSWKTYRKLKILPRTERSPAMPPLEQAHPNKNSSSSIISFHSDDETYTTKAIKNRGSDGLVFFGEYVEMFTLEELLTSSAESMEKGKGNGSVGSTYKAYFESGVEVIVKRLKNVCVSEDEFMAKIEEVGSLVHENLEPLRGYFYGRDEKLLLYEPMPRGSLSQLLHAQGKNTTVSWEIRASIGVGTALAIEYLHSKSSATTHGNIKSSNIFFTDYYNARVTEFGLTQLVSSGSKLNGYRAPEVMDTQKADVYSFGVVLLELVTSKEPDRLLREEGIELPNWVQSVIEEKSMVKVFDPELIKCETVEEAMVQLVHLALSCTSWTPQRRPSMVEVRQRVHEICG